MVARLDFASSVATGRGDFALGLAFSAIGDRLASSKRLYWGWLCEMSSDMVKAEYEQLISDFLYPVRGLSIACNGEPPLNTLVRWEYREATDPRDKVCGFLGLFSLRSLSNGPGLRDVSHGVTSSVLFPRVTLDLIRLEKDHRPFIGARELPHITPTLPGWAIDFASSSAIGKRQKTWWRHSYHSLR